MRYCVDGRTIQDHFPGIGRYAFSLATSLLPELADDELILLFAPQAVNTRFDLSRFDAMNKVSPVPCRAPVFSMREQWAVPRLLRRLDVSVFHATYYVKPYRLPLPSVLTYYDVIALAFPETLPSARARLIFRFASRLALASADRVILLSEAARRDVIRYFGVGTTKSVVVYPGADPQFAPQTAESIARVRDKYGLPERYVLYVGINKPHKNLPFLVEAWATAQPDAVLVLAGREDPRYSQARERVRALELERSVAFLGDISEADLPALYAGATLFVFPSLYEGFGLPVLEAMACGAPVLCSNVASLPEVVGEAGVLLPPTDGKAWADALARLLSRPGELQTMREQSLARAAAFFWTRAARETLAIYREVAR